MDDLFALTIVATCVALPFLAFIGWVMNIAKFAMHLGDPLTALELFRAVAIIMIPIGCVLGWIG